jgi:magnesium-transporting ATPase (P-type)
LFQIENFLKFSRHNRKIILNKEITIHQIEDYINTVSIFVAVFLIGIVQAQIQFRDINKMKNEFHVNVIRYGEETQIMNNELLVGDILILKDGDRVATDCFYITGHALKVNNSQEAGE